MKSYAFLIPLSKALAGYGQGTLSYSVPQNAVLHLQGWQWKATAGFNVIGFGDNTGIQFTTATQTEPIDSAFLPVAATPNDFLFNLPMIIDLIGGYQVIINLLDTSGNNNTVKLLLYGVIDYPSA